MTNKTALMRATQRLQEMDKKLHKPGTMSAALSHQLNFMRGNSGLKLMILGLESYCKESVEEFGSKAGDDGFLGDYLVDIARGILGLLNGPGTFDGGTLDHAIRMICEENNIDLPQ